MLCIRHSLLNSFGVCADQSIDKVLEGVPENIDPDASASAPADDSSTRKEKTWSAFCDGNTLRRVLFFVAMFFLTTLTPAMRIENKFLQQAFALRGVKLPTRKQLYEEYLDQCYGYYRGELLRELEVFNGTFQIATDGWKKKAAERGAKFAVCCLQPFLHNLGIDCTLGTMSACRGTDSRAMRLACKHYACCESHQH